MRVTSNAIVMLVGLQAPFGSALLTVRRHPQKTSSNSVFLSARSNLRIRAMAAPGGKHRAVVLTKIDLEDPYGPVAVIEVPTPQPEAGEVLIRMEYRPIHPSDVLMLRGLYPGWIPKEGDFPKSLGHEGVGTVVEVGPGVTSLANGQRVYPFIPEEGPRSVQGTWQEYVAIPEQMCVPIPDQVTSEAAAQFFVNPASAYFMVREFLPHAVGKYVVQSAAGSSLGRLFIQIAHHHGVKTINLVRRDELKADLKALGADEVINYAKEDAVASVKQITGGEMAYAGFDCVGGSVTDLVMSCVREEGIVETYGIMGNEFPAPGLNNLMNRGVKLGGFYLSRQVSKLSPPQFQEFNSNLMRFLKDGVVKFPPADIFALDQATPAMIKSQAGGKVGKVILVN